MVVEEGIPGWPLVFHWNSTGGWLLAAKLLVLLLLLLQQVFHINCDINNPIL